jgi:hypothetical protein
MLYRGFLAGQEGSGEGQQRGIADPVPKGNRLCQIVYIASLSSGGQWVMAACVSPDASVDLLLDWCQPPCTTKYTHRECGSTVTHEGRITEGVTYRTPADQPELEGSS